MKMRKKVWGKKQPIAVTIGAWGIVVLFLVRLYEVYIPLAQMRFFERGLTSPIFMGIRLTDVGFILLTSASYLVLSLFGIVALIGFLRLHRWAWVFLIAWSGISLTISLINYFYSHPNYLVMVSNAVIVFALNQPDVQRIFHIRMDQSEPLS